MKLHELKPAEGSVKRNKRLGRGQGSGGSTAGRGHKGSQSRSGYSRKVGFEGGQMPLQRRVPKFGFKNPNRECFKCINLDTLAELAEKFKDIQEMDVNFFIAHGIVSKRDKIKILGRGELTVKLNVKAHAFSGSAEAAITRLGGVPIRL